MVKDKDLILILVVVVIQAMEVHGAEEPVVAALLVVE